MITVTAEAAKQIRLAAEQGGMEGLVLRLAARPTEAGGLEYGMGFDEVRDDDLTVTSEGVEVVFEPQYGPLLTGSVIDFVEIEPGQFHFIFMNPNDPNYRPADGCGCGSGGGCGGDSDSDNNSGGGCGCSGGGCSG